MEEYQAVTNSKPTEDHDRNQAHDAKTDEERTPRQEELRSPSHVLSDRILEQVVEENRVVLPFPVHANHPRESRGGVQRIKKYRLNGNSY